MTLFDTFNRDYTDFRMPQESYYAFLNRSALLKFQLTRDLLESWFRNYPAAHQNALRTSFRTNRDTQHWGAFFELYCHALLCQQNFIVDVQKVVDQSEGRPIDFLVSSSETPLFYMEATVAADANPVLANQRKIGQLIDTLNTLNETNFQLSIEVKQESPENLPLSQIRTELHRWLQSLNPDVVAKQREMLDSEKHSHCTWTRNGWEIVFFAIPRDPEDRGTPGETVQYQMWNARRVEAENSLRNALESKADRYGVSTLPYIIAVDVLAIDSLGTDIGEILFGREIALFNTLTEEITLARSPLLPNRPYSEKGLWFSQEGPRNQQASAVLLVNELMPWSIAHKTPILWHNPWAEKSLDPALWQGPQIVPDMNASPPYMQLRDGKQAHEIFHLPSDWPDITVENNI